MLRAIVLGFGILCCIGGGLGITFKAGPESWGMLLFGLLTLAGTLFERRYNRNHFSLPEADWERTAESFIDPSSGEHVEVWFNPHNGKRRYIVRK